MNENERLKIIRKELGYTQQQFANLLGVKQGSYSDIERGKVGISGSLLKILVKKYKINPIWLYEGTGNQFLTTLTDLKTLSEDKAVLGNKFSLSKCPRCIELQKIILAHQRTIDIQQDYINSLKANIESIKGEKIIDNF